MGHCDEIGYALWAPAANLVMGYGPVHDALWASAADLFMRYAWNEALQ
jgi:hypothetical protein